MAAAAGKCIFFLPDLSGPAPWNSAQVEQVRYSFMRFVVCAERIWSPVALVRFDTGPVQFTGHTGICQTNNGIT
jgi:hypothetical protein